MKICIGLAVALVFISSQGFALDSACLPLNTNAKEASWPVCGIYMHGLFGSSPYSPKTWELPFRKRLEKIARTKQCRIAVPIGD